MAYYVYILTNKPGGTLYIGVTNNVAKRVWDHRQGVGSDFTKKYNLHKLVYVEEHANVHSAIQREKTMKEWKRSWKTELIEKDNPDWNDLYDTLNA